MVDKVIINGFCNDQFKAVKEIFAKNFEEGLDVGARTTKLGEALYKSL
ncbi:hypothetical protein ES705_20391 [subsurface metagenome]